MSRADGKREMLRWQLVERQLKAWIKSQTLRRLINFEQKSQEAILLYHVNRNKTTDDKVLPNIFPRRAPVMNDFFSPHFVLCRVALFLQFAVRSSDE